MGEFRSSLELIGRSSAMMQLTDAYDRVRQSEPVIVLVTGEAGIGKTRLVDTFVAELGDDAQTLAGTCLDLLGVPLVPLISILRDLVRGEGTQALRELVPESTVREFAILLPELGDPPPSAVASQSRFFAAVLTLLERLAAHRPLVVVIEDLHMADQPTRELLTFLTHQLDASRVMVLLTCRELPPRHPLRPVIVEMMRTGDTVRVYLQRLTQPDVGRLVTAILGHRPPEPVIRDVFARSEGNPLYVEAMVADADLSADKTLRDILLLPVEQLPEGSRRLLRALAASQAVEVEHAVLASVTRLSDFQLEEALRPAIDAQVLVVRGAGYALHHGLVGDLLYETTLPSERTRLHRHYAEALAATDGRAMIRTCGWALGEVA